MTESVLDIPLRANLTYWMAPGLPHDGFLGEFLMRSKAVIRDAREL